MTVEQETHDRCEKKLTIAAGIAYVIVALFFVTFIGLWIWDMAQ